MQQARRRLLVISSALLAPVTLFAQSKSVRVPRIGFLLVSAGRSAVLGFPAFEKSMRGLGYAEGRDVAYVFRFAKGDVATLPTLARELVQEKVDVIVTGGTLPTQAAQAATRTIPIVATGVADLAESGMVASLAKPGGNITGVAVAFPETGAKQLEIMLEVLPHGKRVAVLWPGPVTPFFVSQRKELQARASRFDLSWHATHVRTELQAIFQAIRKFRPDFLVALSDSFYFAHRKELVRLAAEARIPAVYGFREYVDEGGLMSYGANITEAFQAGAAYVDRILRGAKPADLPVQMPSKLELALNTKAARELGLSFPQSLLARADVVVE